MANSYSGSLVVIDTLAGGDLDTIMGNLRWYTVRNVIVDHDGTKRVAFTVNGIQVYDHTPAAAAAPLSLGPFGKIKNLTATTLTPGATITIVLE